MILQDIENIGLENIASMPSEPVVAECAPSISYKMLSEILSTPLRIARWPFCEEIDIKGLENADKPGPFLWICKHESRMDVLDLVPEYWRIPNIRRAKGVVRDDFIPKPISYFTNWAGQFMFDFIQRTLNEEGYEGEELERRRKKNREIMSKVHRNFEKGVPEFIWPEGTTRNEGGFQYMYSGAYNLSHRVDEGTLRVLKCVVMGNTNDYMSGDNGNYLVFLRLGPQFSYSPVKWEGENGEEYLSKDRDNFKADILERMVDMNTITVSQLGGIYLRHATEKGRKILCAHELYAAITGLVSKIKEVKDRRPIFFDHNVNNYLRIRNFHDNLVRLGYVSKGDMFELNADRILAIPKGNYKKENPLRYMTNRFLDVMRHRPKIKSAVSGFLGSSIDYKVE